MVLKNFLMISCLLIINSALVFGTIPTLMNKNKADKDIVEDFIQKDDVDVNGLIKSTNKLIQTSINSGENIDPKISKVNQISLESEEEDGEDLSSNEIETQSESHSNSGVLKLVQTSINEAMNSEKTAKGITEENGSNNDNLASDDELIGETKTNLLQVANEATRLAFNSGESNDEQLAQTKSQNVDDELSNDELNVGQNTNLVEEANNALEVTNKSLNESSEAEKTNLLQESNSEEEDSSDEFVQEKENNDIKNSENLAMMIQNQSQEESSSKVADKNESLAAEDDIEEFTGKSSK